MKPYVLVSEHFLRESGTVLEDLPAVIQRACDAKMQCLPACFLGCVTGSGTSTQASQQSLLYRKVATRNSFHRASDQSTRFTQESTPRLTFEVMFLSGFACLLCENNALSHGTRCRLHLNPLKNAGLQIAACQALLLHPRRLGWLFDQREVQQPWQACLSSVAVWQLDHVVSLFFCLTRAST